MISPAGESRTARANGQRNPLSSETNPLARPPQQGTHGKPGLTGDGQPLQATPCPASISTVGACASSQAASTHKR